MRNHIQNRPNDDVQTKNKPAVASWREVMNTFNIEFPSICMRALNDGYSTCGMEYQEAHYSGKLVLESLKYR